MNATTVVLIAALSFCVGMLVNEVHYILSGTVGVLKVDHSNPEKDVYLFEVGDLDSLNKKKHVTLKVVHKNHISQK